METIFNFEDSPIRGPIKVLVEKGIQVENFMEYWGTKPEMKDAQVQSLKIDLNFEITESAEFGCQTEKS